MRAPEVDSELARLRALGDDPSEEAIAANGRIYAALHAREPYPGVTVTRDVAYGPRPRQRLDAFAPAVAASGVLVFVHGGGYVSGDKRLAGTPYYDNVGRWAAAHGFAGVTMNYRFAPEATWPSGADDVRDVVAWVQANASVHRGDAARIFLMGHSAGAAHIAAYIARTPAAPVAGAILASGVYDLARMERSPRHVAYFGDGTHDAERSSHLAVAASPVPVLVTAAELEPRKFHPQFESLARALLERRGRAAPAVCLPGHTHFSPIFSLGTEGSIFGEVVRAFVEGCT